MRRYRLAVPLLLGLSIVAAAACAPMATAVQEAQVPAIEPGMARVWFLRASDSLRGVVQAAAPIIFANDASVGDIPVDTTFFRDFPPGTYRFTVQPYGLPTSQAATILLAPGMQAYLQVQWAPSWEFGYPEATWSAAPNTFVVFAMAPQVAEAYLPTVTYLGRR